MKIVDGLSRWFKRQLSAESPRRIVGAVIIVACLGWLAKTAYHEWHIMRVVTILTDQLQKLHHRERHLPVDINSNRA